MTAPRTAQDQHLRDLATFRLAMDRTDREYAQPADVDALAHGVNMAHRTKQRRTPRPPAPRPTHRAGGGESEVDLEPCRPESRLTLFGLAGFNAAGAWPGPPDTLVSGVSGKPGEVPIEEMRG